MVDWLVGATFVSYYIPLRIAANLKVESYADFFFSFIFLYGSVIQKSFHPTGDMLLCRGDGGFI